MNEPTTLENLAYQAARIYAEALTRNPAKELDAAAFSAAVCQVFEAIKQSTTKEVKK